MTTPIKVTSHVARDFLQNAVYFSTVPKVVWEYVSNAIDNPGARESVTVEVRITRERIIVRDNGSGMTRADLNRFFTMHGENLQRRQGRKVRGKFGTGKCAAFGVANRMHIETVRAGLRNVVELDRRDIVTSTGDSIPVRDVVVDAPTNADPGTTVIIADLTTKQLEIQGTISYVERHLGRRRQSHTVTINDHLCEREEPIATKVRTFTPPPAVAAVIGEVTATVKVAPAPLDAGTAGIDVFSYGNWHDTTLAGLPDTEMTRRLFGDVDVPALEEYDGPFPPFDNTRNNTLSPRNPLVVTLFGWLATALREVLKELDAEENARKRSTEAKALRAEATRIESALNDDFRALQIELERARGIARTSVFAAPNADDATGEFAGIGRVNPESPFIFPEGVADDAAEADTEGVVDGGGSLPREPGLAGREPTPDPPRLPDADALPPGPHFGAMPEQDAALSGTPGGRPRDLVARPRQTAGFSLDFRYETEAAARSRYEETTKTIVINLDHPQLQAARKLGSQESTPFRQVVYELAFVEYALALGNEHLRRDPLVSGEDALYEIRETINRVSRRIAALF